MIVGMWAALTHPTLFLVALVIVFIAMAWVLPKILRGIGAVGRKIGGWFGTSVNISEKPEKSGTSHAQYLQQLADAGVLSDAEFRSARARVSA